MTFDRHRAVNISLPQSTVALLTQASERWGYPRSHLIDVATLVALGAPLDEAQAHIATLFAAAPSSMPFVATPSTEPSLPDPDRPARLLREMVELVGHPLPAIIGNRPDIPVSRLPRFEAWLRSTGAVPRGHGWLTPDGTRCGSLGIAASHMVTALATELLESCGWRPGGSEGTWVNPNLPELGEVGLGVACARLCVDGAEHTG